MEYREKKILVLTLIFAILGLTVAYIFYSIGKKLKEKEALNTASQESVQEKNSKITELEVLKSLSIPEGKVKTEAEKKAEEEALKLLSVPPKKNDSNETDAEQIKKDLEALKSLYVP